MERLARDVDRARCRPVRFPRDARGKSLLESPPESKGRSSVALWFFRTVTYDGGSERVLGVVVVEVTIVIVAERRREGLFLLIVLVHRVVILRERARRGKIVRQPFFFHPASDALSSLDWKLP